MRSMRHQVLAGAALIALAAGTGFTAKTASANAARLAAAPKEASPTVSFRAEVQGLTTNFNVFFATVMPGEVLNVKVLGRAGAHNISFEGPEGAGVVADDLSLAWTAPSKTGLYPIIIRDSAKGETMTLNVFVMEPASNIKDGVLNGYRIGAYPEKPLRGNPIYNQPRGFIEVTPELAATPISPNFTLGQFLCKQQTTSANKYVVLQPALLVKLEQVMGLLADKGIDTDTLFIMSGYRTPYYNAAIKNVPYSRHVFGDAADVYVDFKPRDGDMDDLNADGVVDRRDAAYLYDLVDEFDRAPGTISTQGGIGEYDRNAAHGPFVHIDVRGNRARWGR